MPPLKHDLDAWAGNNEDFFFGLQQENESDFDLSGSKLVFRALYGATAVRKSSDVVDSGLVITDAAGGEFEIHFSVEETRAWPDGTQLRYEIERWIGANQKSYIYGTITVTAWVNDDVDP